MSWHVDETYLKVRGNWVYLYRAVDRDGNLIDAMLSGQRNMAATKAFFRSAKATVDTMKTVMCIPGMIFLTTIGVTESRCH